MIVSQGISLSVSSISEPEPVSDVALTAGTVSKSGLTLTVSPTTTSGANVNSVITVVPTCGGIAESRQTPNCTSDDCPVTTTKAGCAYSFSVEMQCDSGVANAGGEVYSVGVAKSFCTS